MALTALGWFLLGSPAPTSAQPKTEGRWERCVDLVVYVDVSKSMTVEAGGQNYKKAMQNLRDLTKEGKPLWLGRCVYLEVSFFGKRIAGGRGPIRIDRSASTRPEVDRFMTDLEQQGLSYGDDVTNYTNMAAVMDMIRLKASDTEIPRRPRKMFLVYSDFAHDPEGGGVPQDTSAIQRLLAEELEGNNGLLWKSFDDPSERLLIGHIFSARNPDDTTRQLDFVRGFSSLRRRGIYFLENPSSGDLESLINECMAPLSLDAKRSSDNRGWIVDIKNLEEIQFSSLELWITCDTELPPGVSHRRQVRPFPMSEIAPGELLQKQRVEDPFLLSGTPLPDRLVKCILEVFGRSSAMDPKGEVVGLGAVTVFHGVFIELDLDYVRPEFSFLVPRKPTAQVIFKLRGQIAGGEDDCQNIKLNLLVRRGDGAISLLKRNEVSDEIEEVSLSKVRSRAGEVGQCSLHPQKWQVFTGKFDLDKTAREVPLCGHKPPPLVFRVVAKGGATAQDEKMWKSRFDEVVFPKRDGDQQGHELTREIILPVCLSALLAGLFLKFRRTRVTMDDFTNVVAFVLIIAAGLYAILHEYTLVAKSIENFVSSQGPAVAFFLAICILILVYCGWRWGIFGLAPTKELTRSRLLKQDMRKTIRIRKRFRFIPLVALFVVTYALYLAWKTETWEHQCAYQDIYVPPSFLERLQ